jgi:hypothetical protein
MVLVSGGKDRSVRLWDTSRGVEIRQWLVPEVEILKVALTGDGQTVCALSADQAIHIWSAATGERVRQFAETGVEVATIGFNPNGSMLAVGSRDGIVRLWDVGTGTLLRQLTDHPGGVTALAFSADGKVLAAGSWLNVRLWELATGRECCRFDQQPGFVLWLAFAPEGTNLAAANSAGHVLIIDLTGSSRASAKQTADVKEGELQALWEDLGGDNATRAYRAAWILALHADRSVPYLAQRLRPTPALDQAERQRIAQWVMQLDNDDFAVREQAARQLARVGEAAEPEFRKAMVATSSPEMRRRIAELRERSRGVLAERERLRATRAVAVLEQAGTAPALAVLKLLAGGGNDAASTRDARDALERLRHR